MFIDMWQSRRRIDVIAEPHLAILVTSQRDRKLRNAPAKSFGAARRHDPISRSRSSSGRTFDTRSISSCQTGVLHARNVGVGQTTEDTVDDVHVEVLVGSKTQHCSGLVLCATGEQASP